jgi:RimJ/RimL family protein N-acetyltransferase
VIAYGGSMETKRPDPLPRKTLETDRLILRPWREEDIPEIFRICQDADIRRWTLVPSPYQLKDAQWFVREFVPAGFAKGDEATYGMFVKGTGQIAGSIALMGLAAPRSVRTAEVGFWAAPETRGRGYMTEAVLGLARYGFEELGVQRVFWQAYDGNEASRRVIEKAGFTVVGRQRASHQAHGRVVDMWLADLLPGDLPPAGPTG